MLVRDSAGRVLYINQAKAENGFFSVPIAEISDTDTILSNKKGMMIKPNSILYCSQNGKKYSAGTKTDPLSFQSALEMAEDGCIVKVMDELTLLPDFEWPVSDKSPCRA